MEQFTEDKILRNEKCRKALEKCKMQEKKKLKEGYTWVKIDEKTRVLKKKK